MNHPRLFLSIVLAAASLAQTRPTAPPEQPAAQQSNGVIVQKPSAPAKTEAPILINNVRIFDGIANNLRQGNVLIVGSTIKQISASPIAATPNALVIDGGGRVLMPGLTDAHWHTTMAAATPGDLQQADTGLMYAKAVAEARRTLLRGFTTVRDRSEEH